MPCTLPQVLQELQELQELHAIRNSSKKNVAEVSFHDILCYISPMCHCR